MAALTKEGVAVPLVAFSVASAGLLAPKLNDPMGAGAFFSASVAVEDVLFPPKLNDPSGAGAGLSDFVSPDELPPNEKPEVAGLSLVSAGLEPKLKVPSGAGAGLSEDAGVDEPPWPNENGAEESFLAVSAGLGADDPNENGVGAATTGVAAPESGADLRPKKLGTSPDSLGGVVVVGGAEGLPRPKLKAGLLDPSVDLGGANKDEGACCGCEEVGGVDLPPDSEKKPFSSGLAVVDGGVGAFVSGESGSATTEVAAKGEDARGLVAFSLDRGPPVRGTPRPDEVEAA